MSYKAHGEQVRVSPGKTGIPWDQWILRAPVCDTRELTSYIKRRAELLQAKSKSLKKPSGALPNNTDWL